MTETNCMQDSWYKKFKIQKKGKVSADLQKLVGLESSLQHFPEKSPSATTEELQASSPPVS